MGFSNNFPLYSIMITDFEQSLMLGDSVSCGAFQLWVVLFYTLINFN